MSRCQLGAGETCFRTLVLTLPDAVGGAVYRVATLTASAHAATNTSTAHQRLFRKFLGFVRRNIQSLASQLVLSIIRLNCCAQGFGMIGCNHRNG